ncbi:MAG: glycosyltransferase, partial [Sphingobium sp.]
VHVQWMPLPVADAHWLGRWRALGGPALVHTVHNASAFHGERDGGAYARLLMQFDRLIVHGEETRSALRAQGIAEEHIALVPHPPMRLRSADPLNLGAIPDPKLPRLLFFGTIRPYKGFDLLIAACFALWRDGAKFELAVAGKPFMNIEPLIEQVRAAGFGDRLILDLDFLREEQLDAHLQKADMIVFPYRHIDSSGAFLSALHYGKAMICTRVGMFGSLKPSADGEGPVVLCDPDSASALAEAIRPLIGDLARRQQMGIRARELGDAMGGWPEAASATVRVYEDALARVNKREPTGKPQ